MNVGDIIFRGFDDFIVVKIVSEEEFALNSGGYVAKDVPYYIVHDKKESRYGFYELVAEGDYEAEQYKSTQNKDVDLMTLPVGTKLYIHGVPCVISDFVGSNGYVECVIIDRLWNGRHAYQPVVDGKCFVNCIVVENK